MHTYIEMTTPLARRLAGPSFSFNVRFDQQLMTKLIEDATVPLKLKNADCTFVSEYEVFGRRREKFWSRRSSPGAWRTAFAGAFRLSTDGTIEIL